METNTERNCRVQKLYDELMAEGKHGHYETMFRIVRLEVEAEREACAKVCEDEAQEWRDADAEGSESLAYEDRALEHAAEIIRMRSNAVE